MQKKHKTDAASLWQRDIHQNQIKRQFRNSFECLFSRPCYCNYIQVPSLMQYTQESLGKDRMIFHKKNRSHNIQYPIVYKGLR